jgi:hypothetical protein
MSCVRFCPHCNYSLKLHGNTFKCVLCETREDVPNNHVIFRMYPKGGTFNREIPDNKELNKYDIYKRTKTQKCKRCSNNVMLLYSDISFNAKMICTECNAEN